MMMLTHKDREKQRRDALTDVMVRKNIYIRGKGSIQYNQITPEMIIEKRAAILAWRERKANPITKPEKVKVYRACIVCGKEYEAKGKALTCGDECRKADGRAKYYADHDRNIKLAKARYIQVERNRRIGSRVNKPVVCGYCGESFTSQYGDGRRLYCSATCQKRSERWASHLSDGAVRRDKAERHGERFKVVDIYERDRWVCGICHSKVNRKAKYPHPMSASLDHIIPLAKGGTHTRDNVQLAHLVCNSKTGAGGVKQLRLFG